MAKSSQLITTKDFQPGIGVLQVTGYKNESLRPAPGIEHYVVTSDGVPIGEVLGETVMVSVSNAVDYLGPLSRHELGLDHIKGLKEAYSRRKKNLGSNIDQQTKEELAEMKRQLDVQVPINFAKEKAACIFLYMALDHPKKESIILSREINNRAKNYHLSPLRD